MNDLKFFIHYCFSFFTDFYIVPLTKFMLHLWFAFIKFLLVPLSKFMLHFVCIH